MNRCERCRPLILDHLYGLLDGPDEAFVEAHLVECASCAAAHDEAARVQGLFARAARSAFPSVRFEPPAVQSAKPVAATPANPESPRPARHGGRGHRIASWLPWGVAAAILIAIPGTVLPVLGILERAEQVQRNANDAVAHLEPMANEVETALQEIDAPRVAARRELAFRTQHLDAILGKWLSSKKSPSPGARMDSEELIRVRKPVSVQPGAPNELEVFVHGEVPTGNGHLIAEIHEVRTTSGQRTDAVIFSQPLKAQYLESQPLRLPAEAWTKVTPQSELYLVVSNQDPKTGEKTEIQERVRLYGPVFSTMLVTDKAVYRPGETLHFRSLTLDRTSFRPPDREQNLRFALIRREGAREVLVGQSITGGTDLVRVNEGKVEPVLARGKPVRGVGCGDIPLPPDLADGDYTLILTELPLPGGYPPAVPLPVARTVKVHAGAVDEYQKRTGFTAASYTPGTMVNGWAELLSQGRPVGGAAVDAIAVADGVSIPLTQPRSTTGPDGRVDFSFVLPPQLNRGDVQAQVTFATKRGDKTIRETVTRRVPVIGNNVKIEFFPEGGYLIAGVPCRVYVRATTPTGQAVDVRGTITDGRRVLARLETVTGIDPGANRGLGSFTYTPEIDTPVWLKLQSPAHTSAPLITPSDRNFPSAVAAVGGGPIASSMRTGYLLPAPETEGVAMTVLDPVTASGQPIRVHLRSVGAPRKLVVGAYTRGRLSDTKNLTIEPNHVEEVMLMTDPDPRGGVVRITVFVEPSVPEGRAGEPATKSDLKAVAERLVFRKPGEALNLDFDIQGERYGEGFLPGKAVQFGITATDEKGKPAAAILYAAAVNSGVAPGAEDRLLTTHFLIAGEINKPDVMEYADFLLTEHPQAAHVLDLVLATQGWRRFAEQVKPGYIKHPTAPNIECAKLLVTNGQYSVSTIPSALRDQWKAVETFWPQYETAKKARAEALAALKALNANRAGEEHAALLAAQLDEARVESRLLAERADAARNSIGRFRQAGWYGVAGFALLAILLGGISLLRPSVRLPLGIGTAGAVGLVAFLIFALGMAERTQAASTAPSPSMDAVRAKAAGAPAAVEQKADPTALAETLSDLSQRERNLSAILPGGGSVKLKDSPLREPAPLRSQMGARGGIKKEWALPELPRFPLVPSAPRIGATSARIPGANTPPGVGGFGGLGGSGANMGYGMWGAEGTGLSKFWAHDNAPTNSLRLLPSLPGHLPAPAPPEVALPTTSGLERSVAPRSLMAKRGANGQSIPAPTEPPAKPTLIAPMVEPGNGGRSRVEELRAAIEHAQEFARSRARDVTEQMIDSIARRQAVEPETVRKWIEQGVKKGDWMPNPEKSTLALPLTHDDLKTFNFFTNNMPQLTPLVVREFAAPRPGSADRDNPLSDTVLWQPVIVLPTEGKATIPFHLGYARGGYQVIVAGHTLDGRIGAVRRVIPVAPVQSIEAAAPPPRPSTNSPVPPPAP